MTPSPELENLIQVRRQLKAILEYPSPHTNRQWREGVKAILNESLTGVKALGAPDAEREGIRRALSITYDYARKYYNDRDLRELWRLLRDVDTQIAEIRHLSGIYVGLDREIGFAHELRSRTVDMIRHLEGGRQ